MGMEDWDLEEVLNHDIEQAEKLKEFVADLIDQNGVSSGFFAEMVSLVWTYLRMMHDIEETLGLVTNTINRTEHWLRNEDASVHITVPGTDESYEIPFILAEEGGLNQMGLAAAELDRLIGPE